MASIAITVGGAVLNAAAFIGGNYLARALGGGDKAALEEKERHDRALEVYQAAYAKYTRDRTKLLDWIETNAEIKAQAKQNVFSKPSTPYLRPVGKKEKLLPPLVQDRYLYKPGELEGGTQKRATDPIWSLKVFSIERSFTKPEQPVLYFLRDGPKRGFVCEELLVVPPNTQLPPEQL